MRSGGDHSAYGHELSWGRAQATRARPCAAQRSGLRPCNFETAHLDTYIGRVVRLEEQALPRELATTTAATTAWHSSGWRRMASCRRQQRPWAATARSAWPVPRNQHLGDSGGGDCLPGARRAHRPAARIVQLRAVAQLLLRGELRSPAARLQGPAAVVSTACSSSAKVFGLARRYMSWG